MLNRKLIPRNLTEAIIYINLEFYPQSQAKISVLDHHGLMYGWLCEKGLQVEAGYYFL